MDANSKLADFEGICRLFPLPGVVLFPNAIMPLHIFEPRYRQMTEHALAGDQLIAIVQTKGNESTAEDAVEPALEETACLGQILQAERLPDGRFKVLLHGLTRARIIRELQVDTLYRQAAVELVEDVEPIATLESERDELTNLFRQLALHADSLSPEIDSLLDSSPPPGMVTDLIAQSIGLPPSIKQKFLDDPMVERRTENLIRIVRHVLVQIGSPLPSSGPFPPPFSDN